MDKETAIKEVETFIESEDIKSEEAQQTLKEENELHEQYKLLLAPGFTDCFDKQFTDRMQEYMENTTHSQQLAQDAEALKGKIETLEKQCALKRLDYLAQSETYDEQEKHIEMLGRKIHQLVKDKKQLADEACAEIERLSEAINRQ